MAGDLYRPKNLKPTDKLPAIVFVHGTGGVKKAGFSVRLGAAFAQNGYIFLNFDYRGWGESESELLMLEAMPEPDEKGEVTVKDPGHSLANGLSGSDDRHPECDRLHLG